MSCLGHLRGSVVSESRVGLRVRLDLGRLWVERKETAQLFSRIVRQDWCSFACHGQRQVFSTKNTLRCFLLRISSEAEKGEVGTLWDCSQGLLVPGEGVCEFGKETNQWQLLTSMG